MTECCHRCSGCTRRWLVFGWDDPDRMCPFCGDDAVTTEPAFDTMEGGNKMRPRVASTTGGMATRSEP